MSWTLGIDTSSIELGIGLMHDTAPACSISRYRPNSHAEHIAQIIEFLLRTTGITPPDITRIGVAVGPGSFTGLRIGLAFIKGFGFGRPVKVLPVSSLESMARAFHSGSQSLVAAIDARNNEVYWAKFAYSASGMVRLTDDRFTPLATLQENIDTHDIVLIDTLGISKRRATFSFLDKRPGVYFVEELSLQRGLAGARMAQSLEENSPLWMTSMDILPRYLHPSFTERKQAQKAS